jgi:hypothetical protein
VPPSVTSTPIPGAAANAPAVSTIPNGNPYLTSPNPKPNAANKPILSNGQNPISGYSGPSCPTTNCGKCYQVCNAGGYGGASVGGVGNCIIVDIIDACPSESAFNYCKTDVPAAERCGSSSTNSFDIDQSAYKALTGTSFSSGVPNLLINVAASSC